MSTSKNSDLLPKSSTEPAFLIVLRILMIIAVIQVIAATVILAPRLVSTVAGQLAMRAKLSDAAAAKNEEAIMIAGAHQKNRASFSKSADALLEKVTLTSKPTSTGARNTSSAAAETEDGLQPGASLGIINVQHTAGPDREQILKIAIKSRLHEIISVPDVKVQVYFYDEQGEEIVVSKAPVTSRWLNPPVDWKDAEPELLEVTYQPDAANTDTHYAGYIVAVYYKGQLQGYKASPVDLTTQFPIKVYIGASEF